MRTVEFAVLTGRRSSFYIHTYIRTDETDGNIPRYIRARRTNTFTTQWVQWAAIVLINVLSKFTSDQFLVVSCQNIFVHRHTYIYIYIWYTRIQTRKDCFNRRLFLLFFVLAANTVYRLSLFFFRVGRSLFATLEFRYNLIPMTCYFFYRQITNTSFDHLIKWIKIINSLIA